MIKLTWISLILFGAAAFAAKESRLTFTNSSGPGELSINAQCKITLHNWHGLKFEDKMKIMIHYYNHFNEVFSFLEEHCQEKTVGG